MAKNIRISDEPYALSSLEASLQNDSIDPQFEPEALSGRTGAEEPDAAASTVAAALTRRLDALDVLTGQRHAEALHFIPRDLAQASRPVFPQTYRKS